MCSPSTDFLVPSATCTTATRGSRLGNLAPMAAADTGKLIVRGAREHNLRNINVELPRDKMIVFTGLSGSGKSSLAFDTIYAEGQRRYVESLSAYARQFLGQMDKPDVDMRQSAFIDAISRTWSPASCWRQGRPEPCWPVITDR